MAEENKKSWLVVNISPILALIAVISIIAIFFVIIIGKTDEGSKEFVLLIIGSLTGIFSMIYGFHYGSSEGSKDKNKLLSEK